MMTASDIAVLLGEFAATEIDCVQDVTYARTKEDPSAFTILYGGERFSVEIKAI